MFNVYFLFTVVFVLELQGSKGLYWPCESNEDCFAEGSECALEVGQCKCKDFEAVFSEDFTKCLKTSLFGDTCQQTLQCNLMPSGASCKSGVCDCVDGQTYVRGRCRPLKNLGESCNTDIDCDFGYDRESVSCKNNICECANGYYRRYGNICRRKSEIGDACVVDTDCDEQLSENVRCVHFACQSKNETLAASSSPIVTTKTKTAISSTTEITSNKFDTRKHTPNDLTDTEIQTEVLPTEPSVRAISVETSSDFLDLKPFAPKFKNVATATDTANNRNKQLSYVRPDDEDNKTLSTLASTDADGEKYGGFCADNGKPCSSLPHSICSNNVCLCKPGYYNNDNTRCFAELGEIAGDARNCDNTFDESSKKCLCRPNFFYEPNLRGCRKPITFDLSCTSNSQCSPFGAAFCHDAIPRRCTCAEYAVYDQLHQLCVFKEGLGAQCENHAGCPLKNSVCSEGSCICKKNFLEKDGACVAGVNADCGADLECQPENSVCEATVSTSEEKRSCQCRKGFVHFRDECLKEAEEIEDACVETEQCKPLLATCVNKKCTCTAKQHLRNGRCELKKGLGDACSKASECFVEKDPESVECRNSVCECKFGYQAEQRSCGRVMLNKKNSSGRPSALKIVTFLLIGSAFLITSAAIKQAYY